jgi:site-specific DNA recombinase
MTERGGRERVAAIYVRISRDPEGQALGVGRQERDCRKLARDRGWTVADIYSDNDLAASGKTPRPAWKRMLRDIEAGHVDAVIAVHVSRFYRNLRDLGDLIDLADQGQVEIATCRTGDVDLSTARGRTIARINVAIDQDQWETTSELVQRKMLDLASQGKRWGGRRCFGYTRAMKLERREANCIRRGADMILGGSSVAAVVRDWNARETFTPTGRRWSVTRVRTILASALIAGLREHKSGVYPGTWPGIVTPEEHEALRALLTRKGNGNGRQVARRHPLTGTLVCAECGTPLSGRTQPDGRRNYGCPSGQGGCGGVAVGANAAEDYVLDRVQERDPGYERKRRLTAPRVVDREVALALVQIQEERTALERVARRVDVRAALADLEAQERDLQARVRVEPRGADPEKDDPERRERRHAGELTEAEVEQTSAWVREHIERVEVAPAEHTRTPAAERLSITWR